MNKQALVIFIAVPAAFVLIALGLQYCSRTISPKASFNWAIQGQDAAIGGCPGRYASWVDAGGGRFLEGCWGHKN